MAHKIKQIPLEEMLKVYQYDENSPSKLSWRYDIEHEMIPGYIRYYAGEKVGTLTRSNRWQTRFNGASYLVYRIVWAMFHGQIPDGYYINHINCDPSDNTITNLELATPRQNSRKSKMRVKNEVSESNTSGINGVNEERTWNGMKTKMNLYARANWRDVDGKLMRKSFAYSKYGKEEAWRLAALYAEEKRVEIDRIVDEKDNYETNDCKSMEISNRGNTSEQPQT